jgi:hypothetical protein
MPVEGLSAVAGDGAVVLRWTNPIKEISGRPLGPLGAVEIWAFDKDLPARDRPLAADVIEKTARLVRKIPRREFGTLAGREGEASGVMTFRYEIGAAAAASQKLAFAVRVFDGKGRASEFSAPVAVELTRKDAAVDPPAAERVS